MQRHSEGRGLCPRLLVRGIKIVRHPLLQQSRDPPALRRRRQEAESKCALRCHGEQSHRRCQRSVEEGYEGRGGLLSVAAHEYTSAGFSPGSTFTALPPSSSLPSAA